MRDTVYFERAPLEEIVCGVQFTGVEWSDVHFGLFFKEIGERYKQTQRRLPLSFPLSDQEVGRLSFSQAPPLPLLWYESPDTPFLLQVQKDAFLVNWRRQSGKFLYPRFHSREEGEEGVWDRFVREWDIFRNFCENYAIGTPEVLACQLAYIDHMVQGETWKELIDLVQWFRPLEGLKSLESVSNFNLTVSHEFHNLPVRINIRPAMRTSDSKKLFVFEFMITERLSPETSLKSWFDDAHEAIVTDFVEQTTEKAHKEWGYNDV